MQYTKQASLLCKLKPASHAFFYAVLCLTGFVSCSRDSEPLPGKGLVIQLANHTILGKYLTDTLGSTLYCFANDFDGQSNCSGGCFALWPPYFAGAQLSQSDLSAGLDVADFGTINTPAGKQTTYKSWPLYYYAPKSGTVNVREAPGETKGEAFGNVWFVAKPDYSITLVNAQLTGNDGQMYSGDYTVGTGKTLYFSDPKGVSLYRFVKDSFNVNKFTKPDFSNNAVWSIYESDQVVVPSFLEKTLFNAIDIFGRKQLCYKGWPLYYFGADNMQRGQNKGVSVPGPGIWPVMVKDAEEAPKP